MSNMKGGTASGLSSLKRRALSLGAVNAYDYAVQFLLPIVLARCLDPAAFGQYRLMWLVVMTVMAIAPMSMPQGLYYFLPRSNPSQKRLYIHQSMLFLVGAGLISAFLVSSWNPVLPKSVTALIEFGGLVPLFVALWVSSCLLDLLPTVEERVKLQAGITLTMSSLRAITLSAGAFLTGSLEVLILTLVVLMVLKVGLMLSYVTRFHGLEGPWFERAEFVAQVKHAAPFGGSSALYGLRAQADQWVAASLFSLGSFAAFSVATVLGPLVNLFRQSVNHSFLPSMSRQHAGNDVVGMLKLNSHANAMVGMLIYPLLAFAFVFAEDMVSLVYTSTYLEAAPVMRLYIISLCAFVVEVVSIMMLLHEGAYAFKLNLTLIGISVGMSWFGAHHFGLIGAAMGSCTAVYVDRVATLQRISKRTGIPLSRLQDWKTLGQLMLCAALAGVAAWGLTDHYFSMSGHLTRLFIGGMVLTSVYGLLLAIMHGGPQRLALAFK